MYDIVLMEKEADDGLTKDEVSMMMNQIGDDEFFMLELAAKESDISAMGFISYHAADELDFSTELSGLRDFVSVLMDEVQTEETREYVFRDLSILFIRKMEEEK